MRPCPFCGEQLKHVRSLAQSFNPPKVYHEYHHPDYSQLDDECILSRMKWCFTDDPAPHARFLRSWQGWNSEDDHQTFSSKSFYATWLGRLIIFLIVLGYVSLAALIWWTS